MRVNQDLLLIMALGLCLGLAGCASDKGGRMDPFAGKGSPYYKGNGPIPKGGGRYQVGKPYQVAGRWFTPRENPDYDETGVASWYGEAFHRRLTSNGEYFDMAMLSAAHATLPLPSYAKVTNTENGRSVVVRINDRGPFVDDRLIDLSKRSAEVLGFRQRGMARVRVQYIGPAPLNDQGKHLAMMNRKLGHGAKMAGLAALAGSRPEKVQLASAAADDNDAAAVEKVGNSLDESGEGGRSHVVSVATFANIENAEAARRHLAGLGPTRIMAIGGDEGPLYLLQIGPFRSKVAARQSCQEALDAGFLEARVMTVRVQAVASKP